ncbi:MAG: hypothetical protein L6427_09775 [Actinomycetia bacterium]|nr:hypothetical protein [Actinomycetes bacterium]
MGQAFIYRIIMMVQAQGGGTLGAEKVVIDTDPATGYALRDVDDGLALAYLLALPDEFDVLGIVETSSIQ